ncbi:MAG: glycosyltransferase family 4 protein [Rhodospirillaceae bacterium]|nr:glycosyltransferase family 4 protein [Rhodospirillaceae bacterium]
MSDATEKRILAAPGAQRSQAVLLAVASLLTGGAERMVSELARAWAELARPVSVLTLSGSRSDHYGLHPAVRRIALDVVGDSATRWQAVVANIHRGRTVRGAVRRMRPDVVVSFVDRTNTLLLAALIGTGIPVIACERTDPRRRQPARVWDGARRLLYPRAAAVVVQTEAVAGWAKAFVPARKVHVIPNFVRELPAPGPAGQRGASQILAVGRLGFEKGYDVLLHAFAASGLPARGARLTILGEGPERAALEALARRLGIAGAVSLPGVVAEPERWMARCAVFVLPSRFEGFPNALLEAMAMGCAVIAADCDSGPRHIVRDGTDGVLVPVEDVDALAAALVRLIEDAALRARLGAAAVAVRERFSKAAILRRWEAVIDAVAAR